MTVAELIEKLKELPQDYTVTASTQDKHKDNISEAVEMVNLTKECWRKIDFLTQIKTTYGDLKISEIIESLEYQANKFNKRFQDLIKTD